MVSPLWRERFILLSREATLRERSENEAKKRGVISVTRTRDHERNREIEKDEARCTGGKKRKKRGETEEKGSPLAVLRKFSRTYSERAKVLIESRCCFLMKREVSFVHEKHFTEKQARCCVLHAINRVACSRTLTHIEIAKRAAM